MSRPILSRPRTRVYGCNYDKGESYYRPMVDHLDRKYSGRPLFAEPRTSFADEIAARRSDIGSRGLAESVSTSCEDLDLIWDSRGRPVSTDIFEDDFVGTHRRYKEKSAAAFELDLAELRRKRRDMQDRMFDMVDIGAEIERAKTTLEAADVAFQRHASKFDNSESIEDMALAQKVEQKKKKNVDVVEKVQHKPAAFKWTKVVEMDGELPVKAIKARKARIATVKDENDEMVPIRKSSGTKTKGKSGKSDKKKKTVTF